MMISELEQMAKKAAMHTGIDHHVLKKGSVQFAIQPADKSVPDDYEIVSTMIAGVDLLGLAGPPTMNGPAIGR